MKGFTLTELLISMSIISLVLFGGFYAFSTFRQTQTLNSTTETLKNMLIDARIRSTASVGGTAYGVRIESTEAILFPVPYVAGSTENMVYVFPSSVTASAQVAEITFQKITGAASSHGTITLSIPSGQTTLLTIFPTGVIQ